MASEEDFGSGGVAATAVGGPAVGWIINIKENKIFIIIIGVDGREFPLSPSSLSSATTL